MQAKIKRVKIPKLSTVISKLKLIKKHYISLTVLDEGDRHFILASDVPVRMELRMHKGVPVVLVYKGDKKNKHQEVVGHYDGTLPRNASWKISY